jgi:nitroimidazol reductase NimA-like FMN-containing flavoprotein (pyridoxamine 5'-phosphate oxidase superfamily)
METKNLDIYGHEPIPWERARKHLEMKESEGHVTCWLATAGSDGIPRLAGLGAIWVDDKFYFVTGSTTRKGRNLAQNPNCAMAASLHGIDVVVQGKARKVTDQATLERIVERYVKLGWPATTNDGLIEAPYSAPSAGPSPWNLYELEPTSAVGVASEDPQGASRWTF